MSGSTDPVKRQRTLTGSTANTNSVRAKLNEQLTRLQGKHNAEMELLEDIKSFSRQRSAIEKQYAESLHRLTNQYANRREAHPTPELPGFSKHENRGVVEVWKILIEKTEELSKRRQSMSELLLTQVSEEMKNQKRIKESAFKRLIDIAQKMNSEIIESMKDVTTTKKSYGELEKVCEDARSKFTEAETKLRKKDVKFFGSIADLEKKHKKASDRLKSCQKRTTVSRNDYLLSLETTNAHLQRYIEKDLPQLMVAMDGEMYDKIRNSYLQYAQLEADSANYIKAEFEDLREQAFLVSREYMLECFLHKHPVLRTPIQYTFEAYGQDTVTGLSRDQGAEIFLDKDARKWATKVTKDQEAVASLQRQVKGLMSVTAAYTKNPEFGTADAQMEAQQKIDSLLEDIRQLEVHVTKAEARLDALRQAGMDVSKWLQKAEKNGGGESSLTTGSLTPYRISQLSLPQLGGSQEFDVETSSIQSGQMGGEFDSVSIGSARSDALPKRCVALYDYSAQRSDELNITQDEELEVLEWDDGDGWCKGRNKSGVEGYFPQSYVQPSSRSSSPHSVLSQHHQNSEVSVSTMGSVTTVGPKLMLKAIYEYSAQFDEELSFPEGALIRLLRTDDNGVDDGWWEGSYEGKIGVFPSVVVEMLSDGTATPPSAHDITPLISETNVCPSLESPPLPPSTPPPPISPEDLGIGATGPNPVAFKDSGYYNSNGSLPQTSSPNHSYSTNKSYTPSLRVEAPSPDYETEDSYNRTWRIDSFDDLGDESVV